MLLRISLVALLLSSCPTVAGAAAPASPPYGAESPQAVVAALDAARTSKDPAALFSMISPRGRQEMAKEVVPGLLMVLALSDPDDPMPGSKTLPKKEAEAKRKSYRAASDAIRAALRPHGLDGLIGKPPLSKDVSTALDATLAKADTVVLLSGVFTAMKEAGPLLGMKQTDSGPLDLAPGPVREYKITGNRATAKAEKETLEFEKVDGRWYLSPPSKPQQ